MRVKRRKNGAKNTSLFIWRGWGQKIGHNSLNYASTASKLLFLERKLNSALNDTTVFLRIFHFAYVAARFFADSALLSLVFFLKSHLARF